MRKTVVSILQKICDKFPDLPEVPSICMGLLRQISEDSPIKELVVKAFQSLWFTMPSSADGIAMTVLKRVGCIAQVLGANEQNGRCFQELMSGLKVTSGKGFSSMSQRMVDAMLQDM